ncbi:MAG: hypothetical protein WDW36_005662 [Sanguina aurantia]
MRKALSFLQLPTISRLLQSVTTDAAYCLHEAPSPFRSFAAGQPVPATHPQLLSPGELAPGIHSSEFRGRRKRLCTLLQPGACAIIPASATNYMAGVIPYPYRQDPDMMYFTGINQHAVAVLTAPARSVREQGPAKDTYTLFIEPPNPERSRWDGERLDRQAAFEVFGADEVYYSNELPQFLAEMASACPALHFDLDRTSSHQHAPIATALQPAIRAGRVSMLRPLTHHMRLIKSPAEVAAMRLAAQWSAQAIVSCMSMSRPDVGEWEVAARFEYEVAKRGAARLAYPSVVAGGSDACTIHYSRHDKRVPGGQMLLMDAGCEHGGYVSDVSRTWPVSGKFTGPQREVYNIVLETHKRCLAACRPGTSICALHLLSIKLLSKGIADLGLLGDTPLEEIEGRGYTEFYWHSVGHWLGLDTHDTALVYHDKKLVAGHVITIEPGLYIPDEPRFGVYAGIGVRIEDDVVLTEHGCEVLSKDAPIEVEDVERMVGSAR